MRRRATSSTRTWAQSFPAPAEPAEAMDDAVLGKALAHQRSQYQQGLLRILRGGDTGEGFRLMQGAVEAIESLQAATPTRPFWMAATGFFDALAFDGLDFGPQAKPLLAKVDQQVKQLIDGLGEGARAALPRPAAPGGAQPIRHAPDRGAEGGVPPRRDPGGAAAVAGRRGRRGPRVAHPRAAGAHRPAEGHVAQVHLGQSRRAGAVRQAGARAGGPRGRSCRAATCSTYS